MASLNPSDEVVIKIADLGTSRLIHDDVRIECAAEKNDYFTRFAANVLQVDDESLLTLSSLMAK